MSIQKLPLATVQKVRQYIQKTLALPTSEQNIQTAFEDMDEPPEPGSLDELGDLFKFGGLPPIEPMTPDVKGKWLISTVNPADALLKLPGLSLKPGLRLVSYLHRSPAGGTGVIWAVPEALSTTAQLEKALLTSDRLQPPRPEGALADFMEAILGDRSQPSFIIASMLRREFLEFGALGKHCNWSHHRLIEAVPPQFAQQPGADQLKDLSPRVRILPDERAAVEFFTCRLVAPIAIYRHIDLYPAEHYTATSLDRAITGNQRQN